MVNAHLHHIGVRVVATMVAGDDNETRPWELLVPHLSWFAWAAAQTAVAATALGLVAGASAAFLIAGCSGALAVFAMAANALHAAKGATALARLDLGGLGVRSEHDA